MPPVCLGSAAPAASSVSVKAFIRNISLNSLSVVFWFYFLIWSSPAFLEVWWEEEDCPALGGLDCNFCSEAPRASEATPVSITQKPIFI